MDYTDVILTILSIIGGLLAIAEFYNFRKKESKDSGEASGALKQKVNDIDIRTIEIARDIREMRNRDNERDMRVTEAHESAKSAHKRIDLLEQRIYRESSYKTKGGTEK